MPSNPSLQVKEVAEWDAQSGLDLLFLGDSIMESWRGTFMGMSWSPFSNVPALFKTAFGAYDAARWPSQVSLRQSLGSVHRVQVAVWAKIKMLSWQGGSMRK